MRGVSGRAGLAGVSRYRRLDVAFRLPPRRGRPGVVYFRGRMPGRPVPLPTRRVRPRGRPRMPRGRCGSLTLHRTTRRGVRGQGNAGRGPRPAGARPERSSDRPPLRVPVGRRLRDRGSRRARGPGRRATPPAESRRRVPASGRIARRPRGSRRPVPSPRTTRATASESPARAGPRLAPTPAAVVARGFIALESAIVGSQLIELPPFSRPRLRAGAFAAEHGTVVGLVSLEQDPFFPPEEPRALYDHLTGDDHGKLLFVVEGAAAVHNLHTFDAEPLLHPIKKILNAVAWNTDTTEHLVHANRGSISFLTRAIAALPPSLDSARPVVDLGALGLGFAFRSTRITYLADDRLIALSHTSLPRARARPRRPRPRAPRTRPRRSSR